MASAVILRQVQAPLQVQYYKEPKPISVRVARRVTVLVRKLLRVQQRGTYNTSLLQRPAAQVKDAN